MNRHRLREFGLLIAVLLLTGCADTIVKTSWKDPGYQQKPHKVLAVALLKNNEYRMAIEDEFALQLERKGLAVVTGSRQFPTGGPSNRGELEKYLRDNGYDSFLLMRVITEKDLYAHRSGSTATWPSSFNTVNGKISSPDYVIKERLMMTETNLYDVTTEKLFWTAAAETTVDKVNHKLIADYVTQILKKMQSSGLVH